MEKNKQKQLITEIMNEDAKDGLYKKQTAVEWLAKEISNQLGTNSLLEELFEQAKQMEKQQIIDAWTDGNDSEIRGGKVMRIMREKYYMEEYGK